GDLDAGRQQSRDGRFLPDLEKFQRVVAQLAVYDLAAKEFLHQLHRLARGGGVLITSGRSRLVDHLAAQTNPLQPQLIQSVVDVDHPDLIDQHIGRGVVAQSDHQRGQVAQTQLRSVVAEIGDHAAAADLVFLFDPALVGQFEFALGGLFKKLDQNRDLDRPAGRECELIVDQNLFAGGQVLDRHSHHAVVGDGDLFDFSGQFAAEHVAVGVLRVNTSRKQ